MAGMMNIMANPQPQDSMHLRIKRKNTTVFLLCYPEQNVMEVKNKIGLMFQSDPASFRLVKADMILDESATIRAQQISSNDIIHLVYKIDGSDQYEKVEWDDLDRLHAEYEAKTRSQG
uniref:Ubiquitin-like domain-containing protein n=1 Tax=Alexandrium catenella TaxID=2925 RepID=A0A7S1RJR0_ALECA|mmetsp:Transcript_61189/g.163720  ORF Transcript_61189/g.163720 Transcript_61189/m.163720 type:complete len:118 (+) Transcript_61189:87-440(+)